MLRLPDWYPTSPYAGMRLQDVPPDQVAELIAEIGVYVRAVKATRALRRGRAERRDPRWAMARDLFERCR